MATFVQGLRSYAGRWSAAELRRLVQAVAARRDLWPHAVTRVEGGRSYRLAFRDDLVEVWVVSWEQDTTTDLHDHGGSVGAMTMLDGALTETFAVPGGLRRRVLHAGGTIAFPSTYVHDVTNEAALPALSVQAYSPPLTQLTYYVMAGGVPVASERAST